MSDENKFFRLVWRFNALALAGIILFAISGFVYRVVLPGYHEYFERPTGHFAPVPKGAEADSTYRLQSLGSVEFRSPGGQTEDDLLFGLGGWPGGPNVYGLQSIQSGGHKEREPYRTNLLLVNGASGQSHWLFKGYTRNILNWQGVFAPEPRPPAPMSTTPPQVIQAYDPYTALQSVMALVISVIDEDTNKDGQLTGDDRISLYVYRPGDGAPAKVLTADIIRDQRQIGTDKYVIVYENGKTAFAATYALPGFKRISETPLPKVRN